VSQLRAFEFTDQAPASGPSTFVALVPAGVCEAPELLKALYERLELPGYFGFNWDALSDCLRDFHWRPEREVVLVHEDIPNLPEGELRTYLEVLCEALASWGPGETHRLRVVFPPASELVLARTIGP
jgi:hypothetical protein